MVAEGHLQLTASQDYSLRAKDFGKKKAQLKSLRQKASERNEDEFYFGMMSRKGPGSRIKNGKSWTGTVEGDRGNKAMSVETVRLLKTQDMGYIRTMRQVVAKEIARLEQQVVLTRGLDHLDDDEDDDGEDDADSGDDMPKPSKPKAARKIVFLDDQEEREAAMLEKLEAEQEDNEDGEDASADKRDQDQDEEEFERARNVRRLRRRLANAKSKLKAFNDAEAALDVQRAKMAKTATSGGQTRRGKKLMVRARKR